MHGMWVIEIRSQWFPLGPIGRQVWTTQLVNKVNWDPRKDSGVLNPTTYEDILNWK